MLKQKYPITYWYNPAVMDEAALRRMKEAGFTQVIADRSPEENKRIIEWCRAEGLEVLVCDPRIIEAVKDSVQREKLLRDAVDEYKGCTNVYGYYIMDEPSEKAFDDLGHVREILEKLDPSKLAYVNLLPNYATLEGLGSESYQSHLENFIKTVRPQMLSYDHYHFQERRMALPSHEKTEGSENQTRITTAEIEERAGFFDNIETMRDISKKTGIPFMIIILTVEHGVYRNVNEAEIRWEVFQSLAYGSAKISYFTYGLPEGLPESDESFWKYSNSIVNADGSPTRHYYEISRINQELQTLGSYLAGRTPQETCHIGREENACVKYYEPDGDVRDIETTAGVTLALYEKEILLANKSFTETNRLEITVAASKRIFVMDKTTGEWYQLNPITGTEDRFTLTLMPGDGELIKII